MRTLITGGSGLLGKSLTKKLKRNYDVISLSSKDCDLTNFEDTKKIFLDIQPKILIHLAAQVGGIGANKKNKLEFFEKNNFINLNVIKSCIDSKTQYVAAAGTACAYPKKYEGLRLNEEFYLDGYPEETNNAYAYAKRSLLCHLIAAKENNKLDYSFFIPTNIFGPNDYFNENLSHVIPGIINRMFKALKNNENFTAWGTGNPKRDFLYVDDCAEAISLIINKKISGPINIASGKQYSIFEVVNFIKKSLNYTNEIYWDNSMPDGQQERAINTDKIFDLGWKPKVAIQEAIDLTVAWFINNQNKVRV